jgi:hypothetical protein
VKRQERAGFPSSKDGSDVSKPDSIVRWNCSAARESAAGERFSMALKFTTSYLEDSLSIFRYSKLLGDKAMAQLTEEQLFLELDGESNAITVIVKHMAGNMRSRWTGFPAADGDVLHGGL